MQSSSVDKIETFTFNGIRTVLGGVVLIPLILFMRARESKNAAENSVQTKRDTKTLFKAGCLCGLALFCGLNLQQQAFHYSTAGKVGFVTALYMLLVPIFAIVIGKKARLQVWIGVLLGAAGLYLLCVTETLTLGKGETLSIIGAVFFALHILIIDRYASQVDNIAMSCIQFFVAGGLSLICMVIFDDPKLDAIISALPAILYTGIMSSGVAFTLQIVGQKNTEPAVASLLLCLESVFAALFGWLILRQVLSSRELVGCAVMFIAIVITQIPAARKKA